MASPRARFMGHTLRGKLDGADTGVAHGEDMTLLSPTITPKHFRSPNESITANLATTFPTTPIRPTPNSGKKRQMPDLSRPTATPGHGVKMSMIFRNAATSLQGSRLPTCQPLSNIKKSRLPLAQARSIKFGNIGQDDTMVSLGLGSPQKMSQHSGESSESEWASLEIIRQQGPGIGPQKPTPIAPTPNFVENPKEAKYPILEIRPSLSGSNTSSLGSENRDLHSTHGVPLIMPFPHSDTEEAPRSDVDTWLKGIADQTAFGPLSSPKQSHGIENLLLSDVPFSPSTISNVSSLIRPRVSPLKLNADLQSSSRVSSDKENINLSKYLSSPTHPRAQQVQTRSPSRFCQTNSLPALQHTKAVHFARPFNTQGSPSLPSKRKRPRVDVNTSSRAEAEMPTSCRDFTIQEEQLAEALAQLSPDVERHRKGRGPKRERCMSYWDEDILQPDLQCVPVDVKGNDETTEKGKQVLCESKAAMQLTTDQPFAKETGSASSQFKAGCSVRSQHMGT